MKKYLIFLCFVILTSALLGFLLFREVRQFSAINGSLYMSVIFMFRTKRADSGLLLELHPHLGMYYGCIMGAVIQIFVVNIFITQLMTAYDKVKIEHRLND